MIDRSARDDRGLLDALLGDGRPPLLFAGLGLVLSGGFALFLAAGGHFLPHDIGLLGMTAHELCALNECRVVRFLMHDRVAFGGAVAAIGVLSLWLVEFPLRRGEAWAWWALAISGLWGFGSFLAYLGYGYLDTWHAAATLTLLPGFAVGLARSAAGRVPPTGLRAALRPAVAAPWPSSYGAARVLPTFLGLGMIAAGPTITIVGMTRVFVPTDLGFIALRAADLDAINPRLLPLIAHDRAGYGGAIRTSGILGLCCARCAVPSRGLWQALALSGGVGFATAIGVHPLVDYDNVGHVAPAAVGALVFAAALALAHRPMHAPAGAGWLAGPDREGHAGLRPTVR